MRQWLECPSTADAPYNDLTLYQQLLAVKPSSPHYQFAKPMLDKLNDHLWACSEEHALVALFSTKLSDAEKKKCAMAMIKCHKAGAKALQGKGKLTTPLLKRGTKIWHLFGPNSWLLLNLFSIGIENKSFLEKPVSNWITDPEFIFMKNIIKNLTLINDAAERGVLLAKELQGKVSYDVNERKNLVLAIPELRHKLNSLKREDLILFYEKLP